MFKKPLAAGIDGNEVSGLSAKKAWLGKPTLTSLALSWDFFRVTLLECVMTVSQERNIVSTVVEGRDGTVKEYISDGDYSIEVVGGIFPDGDNADGGFMRVEDRYPLEELNNFVEALRVKGSVKVQSDFLAVFGINSVVVKSYSFSQETHSNSQSLRISMVSDNDFNIESVRDAWVKL
jgi:hypothetical protein